MKIRKKEERRTKTHHKVVLLAVILDVVLQGQEAHLHFVRSLGRFVLEVLVDARNRAGRLEERNNEIEK